MGVIPGATSAQVYRLNIDTGKVILYPPVPGKAFGGVMSYDRRLTKGPDGYLWLYMDNTICRINPSTGAVQPVVSAAPAGGLVFLGKDLYIEGQISLRRIVGIVR